LSRARAASPPSKQRKRIPFFRPRLHLT
jgi:hypothetical protein